MDHLSLPEFSNTWIGGRMAVRLMSRQIYEVRHGTDRRGRPAEEEDRARDRAGSDPALGSRARRARGAAERRNRAARGRQGQEAGPALGRRSVLQAIILDCGWRGAPECNRAGKGARGDHNSTRTAGTWAATCRLD